VTEERNPSDSTSLADALRRAHASAGDCPGAETLFAYAHDQLKASERDRIEAHCLACGECELMSSSFRSLDPPDWERVESAVGGRNLQPPKRFGFWRIFWNPLPAYALVLVLSGVLITQKKPGPIERPIESANLGMFTASPVRLVPDERGAGVPPRVKPDRSGLILFTFFIPLSAGAKYTAELVDSEGRSKLSPVEIRGADSVGQFFLSCPARALSPGLYQLLITESGVEDRIFHMSFRL
jgi:hypothetical protein